jgi:tryptophan-rich sensory protein
MSAIGICEGAAALEGILAGSGVRRRLSELRRPPFSPPFGVWIVIGVYYALLAAVLYRLLHTDHWTSERVLSLVLAPLLLVLNAGGNLFFFRRRDLRASFLINVPYGVVAAGLVVAGGAIRFGD